MNIKPFFLLGMLATSSGMCEIFPSNSIVENYNGVQDNGVQVVNANTVQGNNLAQENAIARQNVALLHAVGAPIADANNPQHPVFVVSLEQTPYTVGVLVANANNPQHLALHFINMEPIIQLVMRSPEPRNRLMQIAVFCEIIQFSMGQPQLVANFLANENNQAFALLEYIGSTMIQAMIRARLYQEAQYLYDIVAFLQRLKDFIDQQNAIVMRNNATNIQLLRLHNTQPWQHSNNSPLVQYSNNVPLWQRLWQRFNNAQLVQRLNNSSDNNVEQQLALLPIQNHSKICWQYLTQIMNNSAGC